MAASKPAMPRQAPLGHPEGSGGASAEVGPLYSLPTLVRGQPAELTCVKIAGQVFQLDRGWCNTLRLEDEWYHDLADPQRTLQALQAAPHVPADLFTFWQRLPDLSPRHPFVVEKEAIAAIRAGSYGEWWERGIRSKVRGEIRKAAREGLVVRETTFDDEFVSGMAAIFNETPVRQGRPFWHYGKDIDTLRRQFSRFVHREVMIGAYVDGRMIGFMMLSKAGPFALTSQIIASVAHRDRSPTLSLIAKAVEICTRDALGPLVYFHWGEGSLAAFKHRCGFERLEVPRYHVPLTWKGRLALSTGMHRGVKAALPPSVVQRLRHLRSAWHRRSSPPGAAE